MGARPRRPVINGISISTQIHMSEKWNVIQRNQDVSCFI